MDDGSAVPDAGNVLAFKRVIVLFKRLTQKHEDLRVGYGFRRVECLAEFFDEFRAAAGNASDIVAFESFAVFRSIVFEGGEVAGEDGFVEEGGGLAVFEGGKGGGFGVCVGFGYVADFGEEGGVVGVLGGSGFREIGNAA